VDADAILAAFREREDAYRPLNAVRAEIADIYAGKKSLVTTELWGSNEKPAVPNLTLVGINQSARIVASTLPGVHFEPLGMSKRAEQDARTKTDVVAGWWEANKVRRKLRRRARHLIGYGACPVMVRPNVRLGIPAWQVWSPRQVFAAPTLDPDEMCPENAIVSYQRTWSWLRGQYPDQFDRIFKGKDFDKQRDARVQILEFWDDRESVLLAVGAPRDQYSPAGMTEWGRTRFEVLERVENRAGVCPFVVPESIQLEGSGSGIFDQNIGLHERQARLMAYEELAIQRSIFTETWVVAEQGGNPQILTVADGRDGTIGKIQGGRLQEVRPDPSLAALQAVDRGERAQRIQGGVPAEFGGESPTNVRTGRRGDSVLSAVVDHPTQEHQELLAESLQYENRIAIAWDRAMFNRPKSVFFSGKVKGAKSYTPRELWDTADHQVRYSHPGSDANGLVIAGGQRVGLGTMSKRSFMEVDPLIDDPERESDRIVVEALDSAILSSIQQQAAEGQIPLPDLARIKELVRSNKLDLEDAVARVQREAQERQAPNVAPVDPGDPEAQPGLAAPGMGAEAGAAAPPPSLEGLLQRLGGQTRLAGNLRLGQRAAPQEESFNQAAGAA
jgi:hypothetical protein